MTFGQRLKKLRIDQNLTQLQLAEMLNLSKANISKYEADSIQPNLETINLIAKIFNVSTDFLLGNKEGHTDKEVPENHKISNMIENALAGTDLTDENGKLNEKGLQAILEVIQNNKELLKSRVKDLKN